MEKTRLMYYLREELGDRIDQVGQLMIQPSMVAV